VAITAFSDFTRRQKIRLVGGVVARVLAAWIVLFTAYNLTPLEEISGSNPLLMIGTIVVLFSGVAAWATMRVLKSDMPRVRAIEAVGLTIPFYLILFALAYLALSINDPRSFSEQLSRLDALYFTITVFATVGFGDITPTSATTRAIVSLQMLLNLVVLGVVVRLILGAAQRRLAVKAAENEQAPEKGDVSETEDRRDE
jgi:voltage-gated potassium channel